MQPTRRGKMIEKGLILTGNDAELLSHALEEVKTKVYAESEASLDNSRALDALVSCFTDVSKTGSKKEASCKDTNPLSKYLALPIIGRHSDY
jgi:hypothetical protein